MFFYAVHPFSSTDHSRLNVESCVMCVANFVGWERGDGRCGLIYLMEMFTANTERLTINPVGNQNKNYFFTNTNKLVKRINKKLQSSNHM